MLVVLGDSFCSNEEGWPQQLAEKLGMPLHCVGHPGGHWWLSALDLMRNSHIIDRASVIVFCHTNASRIPTENEEVGRVDHGNLRDSEPVELAVKLYFSYIESFDFLNWAQGAWFTDLTTRLADKKVIHLHSFPWSYEHEANLANQVSVSPSLASISLNELGAESFSLIHDHRHNHFNEFNNTELARQLAEIVNSNETRPKLNLDKFEHVNRNWDNWK